MGAAWGGMTNIEDIVATRLERLRVDMVASIEEHGITASGRTQRSLTVQRYAGGVRLVAQAGERAPLATLEVGRPPGDVPGGFRMTKAGVLDVSNTFKVILLRWAEDKGFALGWGGATMLGRRIAEQGTRRHREPEDVYSTLVREAAKDIRQSLRQHVAQTITDNFAK